jgi:cell shape-determining protein MreC
LVRPPVAAYDNLVIDAGKDHGFATTSLVYASGNVLIGKVTDVQAETSKVTLFSSPGQKFDVMIGTTHTPAIAVGRGGGQYEAQVPRGSVVAEGDAVSAPSLNGKPFGIVTSVISDPAQVFVTVLFAPPVNLYQLRWALVQK